MDEVEEEVNPQRLPMTEENLHAIPARNPIEMDAFDYRGPTRDAAWFKKRCKELGLDFPDNVYDMMYLYDTVGMRRKQYKALLKRQKRKQVMRISNQLTTLTF